MMGKGMLLAALLGPILLLQAPADAGPIDAKDRSGGVHYKSGPAPVLAPHQLPKPGKYDIYAFWDSTDPYAFNPYIHGQQIDLVQFGPSTGNAGNGNLHLAGDAKYSMVRLDGLRLSGPDWANRGGRLGGGKSQYGLLVDVPAGGSAGIIFGVKKRLDLSEYRGVAVEISNLGDSYIVLRGQIKAGAKGIQSCCGLYPGETDVLYFIFRRLATTAPQHIRDYWGTFKSKCGYPGGFVCEAVSGGEKGMFRKLSVNTSSLNKLRGRRMRFTINRVFGGGRLSLPAPEVLNGPGFKRKDKSETPYLDEFKQWKYDDWYMKVKGDRQAYYAEEDKYLARYPGNVELNKYGSWANGPKLEATGRFRTEKYKGKWWFVDPEGRLFLSQGLCSVSGQDVPRKLRRYRSWGINTIGGRSALPKIWGGAGGRKIVYCIHMDCNKGGHPIRGGIPADIDENRYRADWRKTLHNSGWAKHAKDDPWCLGMIVKNEVKFGSDRACEIFYRVTSEEIKKWCPRMLFLSSRNGCANQHAVKYCDVLSTNKMEVYGFPGHIGVCKTERPMMFTAFTMGAIDANYASYAVSACLTQRHKARMYKEFCLEAYTHPNVIGCHFYLAKNIKFPPIGHCRAFIEGGADMPFYEICNAAREVNMTMYRLRTGEPDPFLPLDDPNCARGIVTHSPNPVPGPNETAMTPPAPSGTRRGPAKAATRRPPPSATRRPSPAAGPKKPKTEALAAYDEALRRRIAEEIKAERRPEFYNSSMRAPMIITSIAAGGVLGVKAKRGPLQFAVTWERLALAERKSIALSVLRDGVEADHELAAFYLLAAGRPEEADEHLHDAGDGATRVRESFE